MRIAAAAREGPSLPQAHAEWGAALLARYKVVLTGSHPEYHTPQMLDALQVACAYLTPRLPAGSHGATNVLPKVKSAVEAGEQQ